MNAQTEVIEAAKKVTHEQVVGMINLLHYMADGCSFINSREFKGGTCAQENGRGYDCPSCAAGKVLKELGLKTLQEEESERHAERELLRALTPKGKKKRRRPSLFRRG